MLKFLLVCFLALVVEGFYLPGIAPIHYCEVADDKCKSDIPIYVNRLVSHQSAIPYEYNAFDLCSLNDTLSSSTGNFGQVLFGDRIRPSPYQLKFRKDAECVKACSKTYEKDDDHLKFLKHGMYYSYSNNWIVDNMPISWCYHTMYNDIYCSTGFPIGCYVDHEGRSRDACIINKLFQGRDKYFIFNHVDITIKYHRIKYGPGAHLVQATLEPKSISNSRCKPGPPFGIPALFDKNFTIDYTYSVKFVEDDSIDWASRWDYVLDSPHTRILWFSLFNALIMVMLLFGIVVRTAIRLRRYLAGYKEMDLEVITATFWTLVFGCLGFLSPASRGAFGTVAVIFFVCLGGVAGYFSARLYKYLGGENWKHNMLMTSLLLSLTICVIVLAMDIIFRSLGSSAALPDHAWMTLLALWLGVLVPLTLVGAYLGFKHQKIITFDHYSNTIDGFSLVPDADEASDDLSLVQTKIKQLGLKDVNPCKISIKAAVITTTVGGIPPYACLFVPQFFIESTLWLDEYMYIFGFYTLTAIVLVLSTICSTISICYYRIAAENYRWWWRSFLTSGSTAFLVFIYAAWFYFTKLSMAGIASAMIYFGYTTIMALFVFLFTGTIGFVSCLCFVRVIHSKSSQSVNARNVPLLF